MRDHDANSALLEVARAFRPRIIAERDRIEAARRIPEDIAQDLANFLRLKGLLLAKYGGGKKGQKYALNPSRIDDIRNLANNGRVSDASMEEWFYKDDSLQSARLLDKWEPI